jgi:3-isopropylmalate/(R)-2-methylmalate dehydratase small subunit
VDKFTTHTGLVVPLDRPNVDTDAIIPKQFMKSVSKSGFGPHAFDGWRYLDDGEIGVDNSTRPLNPDFSLNQSRYHGASILLTRRNFGCGSSREHAPWALQQYGFRVLIGESFAEIFLNNCFKNGVLAIVLPQAQMDELFDRTFASEGFQLTVELNAQVVRTSTKQDYRFEIDSFRKYCLINGFDDIALTLKHRDKIREYETKRLIEQPWLAKILG